jgi:hydrogenase maturation protease
MKIAAIGIGQDMRGDDAAGFEAVRLWEQTHAASASSPDIQVRLITVPALELADALDGADAAVVVDATSGAGEPGTIRTLSLSDLEGHTPASGNPHGWGLPEELRLGKLLGQFSPGLLVRLIGIEAGQMQLGRPLSLAVRAALPLACDRIQAEIEAIRKQ